MVASRRCAGCFRECDCPNPLAPEPVLGSEPTLATLLPGPGEGPSSAGHRERQPLRLRPRHVLPCAVVVGVLAYQVTALVGAWLAAGPLLIALVLIERWRGIELDRVSPARQLRR